MFDIQEHLKQLPEQPGVYIMKDAFGNVIYVGKAVVLKNRVRQYFQSSKNHSSKVKSMVKNIRSFEYIITAFGNVIYVGKAVVLKNRVRQYFQSSKNHSSKVKSMVKNIRSFEYIITDSE